MPGTHGARNNIGVSKGKQKHGSSECRAVAFER